MAGNELFPILIEDTTKPMRSAMGSTLANAWQGILGDRILAWRLERAAKLNDRLKGKLAQSGLKINLDTIPEGFAFKWFEQATQTDEDDILDLFANLLANAAAGNQEALKKRNIDLVSRLSPNDAAFLTFVDRKRHEYMNGGRSEYEPFEMIIDSALCYEVMDGPSDFERTTDWLISLGIFRLANPNDPHRSQVLLTTVGQSLLQALYK